MRKDPGSNDNKFNLMGSRIALTLGILMFVAFFGILFVTSQIERTVLFISFCTILGTSSYRSIMKRKAGIYKTNALRIILEVVIIILALQLPVRVALLDLDTIFYYPVTLGLVPLWVLIANIYAYTRKTTELAEAEQGD